MDVNSKILIIFDIDGILLNSMGIDSKYFMQSIYEEFGIQDINDDWSIYNKITDSGIFEEIYENHFKKCRVMMILKSMKVDFIKT